MPKVLVVGGGESGRGVALLAQARGYEVFVTDAGSLSQNARRELEDAKIPYEHGGHRAEVLAGVDVVVKSPGIPWHAALIASAKTRHIPVQGEMEFCAPFAEGKLIGITGSNGKTTTTLLTGHLLQAAGINAAVGGNVGTSYARLRLEGGYDWYVLELSSFQLEDIEAFHVDIGMLLNLSPDHLDRYVDGMAGYAAAKFRLKDTLRPGGYWLESTDVLSSRYSTALPPGVKKILFDFSMRTGEARTPTNNYDLSETALAGPHNAANASFALTAAELAGASPDVLAKALKTFRNAPHRLETIGYAGGVQYVNDSKATNLDAVVQALSSFTRGIIWIVGGQDKGNDYAEVARLMNRVRHVVAMGLDNSKIIDYFGEQLNMTVSNTHSMKDALITATSAAKSGDVVLLSPACASFDLFDNYIDRGEQFRMGVRALPDFRETL